MHVVVRVVILHILVTLKLVIAVGMIIIDPTNIHHCYTLHRPLDTVLVPCLWIRFAGFPRLIFIKVALVHIVSVPIASVAQDVF